MTASAASRSSPRELLVETGALDRVVVAPERDRTLSDALDGGEQLGTGLLGDHLAEQRAEKPDLGGEGISRAGRPDAERLGGDRGRHARGARDDRGDPTDLSVAPSMPSRALPDGPVPRPSGHRAATFMAATFP